MRHCVDFVADSYPACELKYNDQIFMHSNFNSKFEKQF